MGHSGDEEDCVEEAGVSIPYLSPWWLANVGSLLSSLLFLSPAHNTSSLLHVALCEWRVKFRVTSYPPELLQLSYIIVR